MAKMIERYHDDSGQTHVLEMLIGMTAQQAYLFLQDTQQEYTLAKGPHITRDYCPDTIFIEMDVTGKIFRAKIG